MLTAYVALGSNLGNRSHYLHAAQHAIGRHYSIVTASPIYETPALMPEGAPDSWNIPFLNQVVCIHLPDNAVPHEVLGVLKTIEQQLGRSEGQRWAPRVIDIDLLDISGVCLESTDLILPHVSMHVREFVMRPLCDIAPNWLFPVGHEMAGVTAQKILNSLPKSQLSKWKPHPTRIMAIVNVTPDSFSNAGHACSADDAIRAVHEAAEYGADVIDIGAQSTRPGAVMLSAAEEWQRLEPVLSALKSAMNTQTIRVSVDTFYADIAARVLGMGVSIINDVSGLACPKMRAVLAAHDCGIISMHSLGIPADRAVCLPDDTNISTTLSAFRRDQMRLCEAAGIDFARVTLDAGIGFGKTSSQSLAIIQHFLSKNKCEQSWLIGHSRKSFLQLFTHAPAAQRDDVTLAFSAILMRAHISYLRVHNVKAHIELREKIA